MKLPLPILNCRPLRLVHPLAVLAVAALCNAAVAQNAPKSRVAYFLDCADQITMTLAEAGAEPVKLQRQTQPTVTFGNPANPDQAWGIMLLWCDDDMPIVASSFYMRWKRKELFRELATLTDVPLTASRDGNVIWSPATGSFGRQTLPGAMPPSQDERLRRTQMLRAAERFHVQNLRLMATPLYRYSSKKYGVIDGAMFALVGTHDPDILVLIEAVEQEAGTQGWRYAIGRMRSDALKVHLDDQEVCSFEPYWDKPDPRLPYVEQFDSKLPEEITQPAR